MFTGTLERAILETLAYSDIFEYPLRLQELYRYLPLRTEIGQLSGTLRALNQHVEKKGDYYFLPGRSAIVEIRQQREIRSRSLLPRAMLYGRVLGTLPFVRMVALTGSLAVMNISKAADFDYLLVTAPGRVWTARAFALAFGRITRRQGHILCPNLIISETALAWPLHDLYSAREMCQMVLISGAAVYQRLTEENQWVEDFLPNAHLESNNLALKNLQATTPVLQNLLELPLRGKPGKKFEVWEMNRKIARFSKQAGFGAETVFTAEVCQGNFHHHRGWTREAFEDRLVKMGLLSV